jgi:hypothetical protein
MKYKSLSEVHKKYFKLRNLNNNSNKYILTRYISTGDFEMFDYDIGLLSVQLSISYKYVKNTKQDGMAIWVLVNSIDDHNWSCQTPLILDDADFDITYQALTKYIDNLTELPKINEFLLELSVVGKTMFISQD